MDVVSFENFLRVVFLYLPLRPYVFDGTAIPCGVGWVLGAGPYLARIRILKYPHLRPLRGARVIPCPRIHSNNVCGGGGRGGPKKNVINRNAYMLTR